MYTCKNTYLGIRIDHFIEFVRENSIGSDFLPVREKEPSSWERMKSIQSLFHFVERGKFVREKKVNEREQSSWERTKSIQSLLQFVTGFCFETENEVDPVSLPLCGSKKVREREHSSWERTKSIQSLLQFVRGSFFWDREWSRSSLLFSSWERTQNEAENAVEAVTLTVRVRREKLTRENIVLDLSLCTPLSFYIHWLRLVGSLNYRSLLQNIVSFIGLFCERDR